MGLILSCSRRCAFLSTSGQRLASKDSSQTGTDVGGIDSIQKRSLKPCINSVPEIVICPLPCQVPFPDLVRPQDICSIDRILPADDGDSEAIDHSVPKHAISPSAPQENTISSSHTSSPEPSSSMNVKSMNAKLPLSEDFHSDSMTISTMAGSAAEESWDARTVQVHRSNTATASLSTMSMELLLVIKSYLPPSSLAAMYCTCKRFRYDLGLPTPSHLKYGERKDMFIRAKCLKFLCMLEKDQSFHPSRRVCSTCITTHTNSSFSSEALVSFPAERQCLGSEGRVWLCPHKNRNFEQMDRIQREKLRWGSRSGESDLACSESNFPGYLSGAVFNNSGNLETFQYFYIHSVPRIEPILSADLGQILGQYNLHICPHTKLSDPGILHSFCSVCAWGKSCCKIHGGSLADWRCLFCDTKLEIYMNFERKQHYLKICITRQFGRLRAVTDPDWLCQLVGPTEIPLLDKEWIETSAQVPAVYAW